MSEDKLAVRFSMDEVERMGEALAKSGLFGFKKPEEAIALMLVAQAQGRHPASVAEEYDIIQGRPALRSRAALARFQQAGGRIEWLERTDAKVSARFIHPQGGDLVVSWDMARARAMGYEGKDNWKKQPMIMLSWRVVAEGIRATYPACLSGSYLVEEVQDFEPLPPRERNITPPEKPPIADPQETPPPPADGVERITKEQAHELWAQAKGHGFTKEQFRAKIESKGLTSTNDLPAADLPAALRWAKGEQGPEDKW